uniref:B-cell linker protein-like isoform X2 n=1 Tax=Petromyzon marinus TaxID=7757 RepID=A0AAJ7SYK1_PETMA|nr:B-cell linker protein-like isoform X2 [Petromyzon marinus]
MSARQPKNKNVQLWKPQDVVDWFRQNQLEDCASVAWRNQIDGKALLELHPSVLQVFPERSRMKVQILSKTLGEQPRMPWNKFSSSKLVPNPPDKDYTAQPPAQTGDVWSENEFDTEDDDYEEPDADPNIPPSAQATRVCPCPEPSQPSSEDDSYEEPDVEGPDYDDPSKLEDDYEQTPCEKQKYPPIVATSIGGGGDDDDNKDYIDKDSISINSSKSASLERRSNDGEDQEDYIVAVENVPNEGFLKGEPSLSMRPETRPKSHEKPTNQYPYPLPPKPVPDRPPTLHKPFLPSTPKPGSDNSQAFLKTRSLEKSIQHSSSATNPNHTLPSSFKVSSPTHPKLSSARPHLLHLNANISAVVPRPKPTPNMISAPHMTASHLGGAPKCSPKPTFNADAPPSQAIPGGSGPPPPFGRKVNNGHGGFPLPIPVPEKPLKPKGYLTTGHATMHAPPPVQAGHRSQQRKVSHVFPPRLQQTPHQEGACVDSESDTGDYEIPNEEEKETPQKINDHMNRYPHPTPPPPSRPAPLGPPPVDRVSKPNTAGRSLIMNKEIPSEISAMPRSPLLPQSSRKPSLLSGNQAGHKPHVSPGSIKRSEEDPRMFAGDTSTKQSLGHSSSFSSRGGGGAAVGGLSPSQYSIPPEINNCDRKTAEAMVRKNNKDGAFMVRTSSKDKTNQPYTLVIYYEEKIFNIPIRYLEKYNQYALGTEKVKEEKFDSILDIIEHYKKMPLLLIGGQHGIKKSTLLIHQVRI